MKRYLLFAAHNYAYEMLRPLQAEILRRGHEAAWWLEPTCPDRLENGERLLSTLQEIHDYNACAVFVPGNYVYPDFPGIKVQVFHGYPIRKRKAKKDDHFNLRGWFDIYCTQGPTSTPVFEALALKHKYFKVYETGWPKMDSVFGKSLTSLSRHTDRAVPTVLYAPTFSPKITSVYAMLSVIDRLADEKPWNWIITFHPKLDNPDLIADYRALEARHPNIDFRMVSKGVETFLDSDVLLADSSSMIVEYMMLGQPVVTYCNTNPGPQLINVTDASDIGPALEKAISHPAELMDEMEKYTMSHDPHRDGMNSARVLDAVDDFLTNYSGRLPRKPLNLLRRYKLFRLRSRAFRNS